MYKTNKTKQDLRESEETLQYVMAGIQCHIPKTPVTQVILERIEKDIRLYGDICNIEGARYRVSRGGRREQTHRAPA